MLVNPFTVEGRAVLAPIPGTHIIEETFGVVGATFVDPNNHRREWTVQALYTPVPGLQVGGVRAKVYDTKGFFSFCNQRDLEVLLNIASPGNYCHWLDKDYVDTDSPSWIGLCIDEQDLLDDLYDRELEARSMYPVDAVLPTGLEFDRRVHSGEGNDYIERLMLLNDLDVHSGASPDTRIETIERRWVSVETTPARGRFRLWERL